MDAEDFSYHSLALPTEDSNETHCEKCDQTFNLVHTPLSEIKNLYCVPRRLGSKPSR